MMNFESFGKIARMSREVVITEKIDGTNAQVAIWNRSEMGLNWEPGELDCIHDDFIIRAGSRKRWIYPGQDNYGFAQFVWDNRQSLVRLGPGRHFGEWWGCDIQRGYDLNERRFSLFNTHRWKDWRPDCCHTVPVLWHGSLANLNVDNIMADLQQGGSQAAPGYMRPEGIILYHTQGNFLLKKTFEKDEGKGEATE